MVVVSDQAGFDLIRDWLSDRSGITFSPAKADLLRQRMGRVLRRYGYSDLNQLAKELGPSGAREVQLAVMHAASINHTYFFREPEVLETFMTKAVPTFQDRSEFRIWSAACSTGEEAYTIGIMLAERFGPDVLKRASILGTDISGPVVDRAELGIFSGPQLAQASAKVVGQWFQPTGINQYRAKAALRDACTFRRMNLKATPYPFTRPFQAVFCRNILYYFDRADQAATVRAIYDMVEPGGWLVTSVTESVRDLGSLWEPVATGIYRRPM